MSKKEKHVNFSNRQIIAVANLLEALKELRALKAEWDALSYATEISDTDLAETLGHVEAKDLAAVFVTLAALEALLAAGHATNLHRVTR